MGSWKIKNISDRKVYINAYIKKVEISQINRLTLPVKHLEKEEQTKPKFSRRKKITQKSEQK